MKKLILLLLLAIHALPCFAQVSRVVKRYDYVWFDPVLETVHTTFSGYDSSCVILARDSNNWFWLAYNSAGDTVFYMETDGDFRVGDSLSVGNGLDSDKIIYANNGDQDRPALKYDHAANSWQYSNNGTSFFNVGSGIAGGTDPDVSVAGTIGADTNDHALRGFDGTVQYVYGKKTVSLNFTITNPDAVETGSARATQSVAVWYNGSGFPFVITGIRAVSDSDNYDFCLYESFSGTDISDENDVLIDLIECETDGTECFYDVETTISHETIESGHYIIWEHGDGTSKWVQITISGYLNGDVD